MPGNRKVTSARSLHQSISPTPNDNHSLKIFPSPELGIDELNSQICALRAELRDGRLLQARQRQELNQKTARVDNLTRRYKELRQERQGLKANLGYERDNASAIQKRLNVAVKNHAEAQDKCARTMVECERLRILNEQLSLLNGRFNASKTELEANFEEKIAEIECAFQNKAKETKSAFMRELEETRENLASERIEETKALKKELDSRDARIKKLEHDLIRQCEINAMFTVDYERDTHVRVTNRLSILASEAVGCAHSGVSLHSTASYSSSSRHPLTQLETNNVTVRKRPRVASWRSDKGQFGYDVQAMYINDVQGINLTRREMTRVPVRALLRQNAMGKEELRSVLKLATHPVL
ncbi:hypothetical protein AG1IA_02665 [Rhizoctonia solani AG-1 IA]|uniref:Uncharacterized protein n=1 Tax=Thanatephorus cucumeris (strain AG1-IA) TaxID=983506 RepID=L8X2S1_THACA|nr:hypothetical protein AG1IA_02665 [Rhizoctonia solani AG-1 IA]